jgi:hypothetical protein
MKSVNPRVGQVTDWLTITQDHEMLVIPKLLAAQQPITLLLNVSRLDYGEHHIVDAWLRAPFKKQCCIVQSGRAKGDGHALLA